MSKKKRGTYTPRQHYTSEELDDAALWDFLNDARVAKIQAREGPYFPEKGITAKSLRAYAAACLREARKYKKGGAHKYILGKK